MCRFIAFIIAFCSVLQAAAQTAPVFPFLGQPIAAFRDSIICKDALHLDLRYDEYPACMSFQVTPSTAIYRYGKVEYSMVFLYPEQNGVITAFSHMKSYLENDTGRTVKQDQALLKDYFGTYFGSPVSKRVTTEYSDDRSWIWRKDGIKIILMISKVLKKKNTRVRFLLQLHIEKEK